MTIGDIVSKENYTATAIWCNANNAHIEMQNGQYVVVENPAVEVEETTPTMEERLAQLEADNVTLNDTIIALAEELETALSTTAE